MQSSAIPPTAFQRNGSLPHANSLTPTDNTSTGWVTTTSSWASTKGAGSLAAGGLYGHRKDAQRLAWAGVRHRLGEGERVEFDGEGGNVAHCSQAVLITCLHLSHEMTLREVGAYGWTIPLAKDLSASMLKIMKRTLYLIEYSQQVKSLCKYSDLNCRLAPDPSKLVIQHHLQKARLGAGLHSYVAVIYNGHGIQEPPTEAGELWCYDKSFDECLQNGGGPSEYIPIMLFDLLTWAGASTCYVWDCQHAGRFIRAAKTEAEEIDSQLRSAGATNPSIAELHPAIYSKRQIHFAACGSDQTLPRIKGMPDDLFTACLTTPLRVALLFHNLQTFPLTKSQGEKYVQKSTAYMETFWENMSETLRDRLWSELSAILHTIAWQTLEGPEYQKLFSKSGDVVNNLACGFLLSQRVFGAYKATPESIPTIPSSTSHTLWTTWDLILDNLFEQLPKYFDDGKPTFVWEKDLRLVSFMADQLESISSAGQSLLFTETSRSGMTSGLSRLPIICEAVLTEEFRVPACKALDACIKVLDLRGLVHAVQGGALDVAVELLALQNDEIKPQIISIWSSLVRYDVCILAIAKEGLTAERLTKVPTVRFFLDALQENLAKNEDPDSDLDNEDCPDKSFVEPIVQSAAVLSTIANFVAGRSAPRFLLRTLSMSHIMLQLSKDIVCQWGALLVAEVLGSLNPPEDEGMIDMLKQDLLAMVKSSNVENRAAGVYALSRWLPSTDDWEEKELNGILELSDQLIQHCNIEGSPVVRRELAKIFIRILQSANRFTVVTMWTHLLHHALLSRPEDKKKIEDSIRNMGKELRVTNSQRVLLGRITAITRVVATLHTDPDLAVTKVVDQPFNDILSILFTHESSDLRNSISMATFSRAIDQDDSKWTESMLDTVISSKQKVKEFWKCAQEGEKQGLNVLQEIKDKNSKDKGKVNHELFEKTRMALQAYLAQAGRKPESSLNIALHKPTHESTWTMRHRVLEDSLVIAEQQVGLPWKWSMKDISCPDPWSSITFHSFHSTVMSCNRGHDILLWDWTTSKKTGHVHLNLPNDVAITSARFVNELHETIVILAEITNGDIHILAGPQDPTRIKPIANFHALDVIPLRNKFINDDSQIKLLTTWFRASGRLCVGGSSRVINVWDCPAEKCVQTLETGLETPATTLITEPVSGNLIFSGFADGTVKLYDLRRSQGSSVLSWMADGPGAIPWDELRELNKRKGIAKMGVILGDSKHVSTACYNGLIHVHDIRNLDEPASSVFAHPRGISSASFQPHSGLMSSVSVLNGHSPSRNQDLQDDQLVPPWPTTTQHSRLSKTLSHLRSPSSLKMASPDLKLVFDIAPQIFTANWSLHRTSMASCIPVTEETIEFGLQNPLDWERDYRPYTVMHPLRPFLGVGYGKCCHLRGCGIGKGDDTDSGSYSFLKEQAKYVM
nr:dRaptor [Cryptococcus depauperatus CBS 7841]